MTFPPALPILSLLVWAPALGAILAAIPGPERAGMRRALSAGFAAIALILGALLFLGYEPTAELRELRPWIAPLGVSYELGLDGLGSVLAVWIPLAALLALLTGEPPDRRGAGLVLLALSALLGLTLARDVVLFLAFLGAGLTALTLLHSRARAMKGFFFFQSLGVILVAAFSLVWFHLAFVQTGFPTAEMARFSTLVTYPDFELRMFLLGTAAAACLAPLVPFTSWLSDTVDALSTPGRVLLLGGWSLTPLLLLSKLVLPTLPLGRADGEGLVVWLAALATLYAGLVPFRGEARSSWVPLLVGFQGLALLGLASASPSAVGAGRLVVLQLALGLTALALWSGGEFSQAPKAKRGRLPAILLVAVVVTFPAAEGLPPGWVILREHWDRFPAATALAGLGSIAMVVRLVRKLPTLERAATNRRNLLLVVPLLLWSLLVFLSPSGWTERIAPAGVESARPIDIEAEE